LVANCFLKEGHKKIAALLAEPDNAIFQSRLEGFIKHANLSGIKEVEIINTKTISGENSSAKAYSEMSRIFKNGFAFSALFALSDGAALGVLKAAHDNAVKIPEDLSIIGYDDLPEAQFYHPALSSVRQNLREWGIEALKILKKRWTGYKGPSIQKAMTPELIIRESVYGEKKGMLYAEA
jgi:DNA-binding LacI/PurR family transcriptional regulator